MSKLIRKKDYTTKAEKVKFMLNWLGKDYVETIICQDITDFGFEEDYNLPVKEPKEVESYVHDHLFSILNKNIDQVWESVWEDLSYA